MRHADQQMKGSRRATRSTVSHPSLSLLYETWRRRCFVEVAALFVMASRSQYTIYSTGLQHVPPAIMLVPYVAFSGCRCMCARARLFASAVADNVRAATRRRAGVVERCQDAAVCRRDLRVPGATHRVVRAVREQPGNVGLCTSHVIRDLVRQRRKRATLILRRRRLEPHARAAPRRLCGRSDVSWRSRRRADDVASTAGRSGVICGAEDALVGARPHGRRVCGPRIHLCNPHGQDQGQGWSEVSLSRGV